MGSNAGTVTLTDGTGWFLKISLNRLNKVTSSYQPSEFEISVHLLLRKNTFLKQQLQKPFLGGARPQRPEMETSNLCVAGVTVPLPDPQQDHRRTLNIKS